MFHSKDWTMESSDNNGWDKSEFSVLSGQDLALISMVDAFHGNLEQCTRTKMTKFYTCSTVSSMIAKGCWGTVTLLL